MNGGCLSLWIEVDGWETFNDNTLNFILGTINLGDNEFFSEVSEFLGQFFIVFSKLRKKLNISRGINTYLLTMVTPWSVEFYQNMSIWLVDQFFVVRTDELFDWVTNFWVWFFRFIVSFEFTIE